MAHVKMSLRQFKDRIDDFKLRFDSENPLAIGLSVSALSLAMAARNALTRNYDRNPSTIIETYLFYFEQVVADFESVTTLLARGLISSSAAPIRRMLVGFGRIVYLRQKPEQLENIRHGVKIRDADLMGLLETYDFGADSESYSELCKSTHLAWDWAQYTRYWSVFEASEADSLLAAEAHLLTAQRLLLQILRFVITVTGESIKDESYAESVAELNFLIDLSNQLNRRFQQQPKFK